MPIARNPIPDRPEVYPYQNKNLLKPGTRSLQDYKVAVWDENTYRHSGIPFNSASWSGRHVTEGQKREIYSDDAILTHHTGQKVRYTTDPATGLMVYRGYLYDQHVKDPPLWGHANYPKIVDRSDYWKSPQPITPLHQSNPPVYPAAYNVDWAVLHKPLPQMQNATQARYLRDHHKEPERPGLARKDKSFLRGQPSAEY